MIIKKALEKKIGIPALVLRYSDLVGHLGIVSNKVTEDFLRLEAFIKNQNR